MKKLKIFAIVITSIVTLLLIGGALFYFFYLKPMLDTKPAKDE